MEIFIEIIDKNMKGLFCSETDKRNIKKKNIERTILIKKLWKNGVIYGMMFWYDNYYYYLFEKRSLCWNFVMKFNFKFKLTF